MWQSFVRFVFTVHGLINLISVRTSCKNFIVSVTQDFPGMATPSFLFAKYVMLCSCDQLDPVYFDFD